MDNLSLEYPLPFSSPRLHAPPAWISAKKKKDPTFVQPIHHQQRQRRRQRTAQPKQWNSIDSETSELTAATVASTITNNSTNSQSIQNQEDTKVASGMWNDLIFTTIYINQQEEPQRFTTTELNNKNKQTANTSKPKSRIASLLKSVVQTKKRLEKYSSKPSTTSACTDCETSIKTPVSSSAASVASATPSTQSTRTSTSSSARSVKFTTHGPSVRWIDPISASNHHHVYYSKQEMAYFKKVKRNSTKR